MIVANQFCLYLAVGGLAYLVSAVSDRRGRAIGVIFAIVLGSFFLNFLTQFWEPAKQMSFLGLLDYYRPFEIVSTGLWPVSSMVVLVVFAVVTWVAGGCLFARRDICTV